MSLITKISGLRRTANAVRGIARDHGVGFAQQWQQYRFFSRELGFTRAEFIGYGLWDVNRDPADQLTMISNRDRSLIQRRMNDQNATHRSNDKPRSAEILTRAGVPTVPVLAIATISEGAVPHTTQFNLARGASEIRAVLQGAPEDGVVVKPFDGGMGEMVQVFREASGDGLVHVDGTRWSIDQLLAMMGRRSLWLVEQRLLQHKLLRTIAGETLGTLRLTTFTMSDGTVRHAPGVWKIPIGNSGLDHFSHGAGQLAAPVEAASGKVGTGKFWKRREVLDHHPVTGQPFTGTVIPHWHQAREVAQVATESFPGIRSLGIDIGITDSGPVVIEVNSTWGERIIQAAWQTGLVQGEFLEFLEELGVEEVIKRQVRRVSELPT